MENLFITLTIYALHDYNLWRLYTLCHKNLGFLPQNLGFCPKIELRGPYPNNKVLEKIMEKTVQMNIKDWPDKLKYALWAYRITWKNTIGFNPYQLVYGKEVFLPIEFQIHTFKLAVELGLDLSEDQQHILVELNELD